MSAKHSTQVRAAAYYRMSDPRQEDSVERQESQVAPYAAKAGYVIVRRYVDEGIPGDEISRRKDFQRMRRDAQAGLFDVILCDDQDRFGRFDSIDLGEVVAPLRRKGVWLETVAQGLIDWNSFAGRMSGAIMQEAKLIEKIAISRRVLSGQLLKARRGVTTGGRATYGYRWAPEPDRGKRLVKDGRKAEVALLAFTMYDAGKTLSAIAEELYNRGVPSPRGSLRWTRTVLQRLLSNRRYVGDWTWGVHPQGKRHRFGKGEVQETRPQGRHPRKAPAEDWVVMPNAHEPIVGRDVFERVQAKLAGNQGATTPHVNGGDFVLSRLLVCGHCGSALVGVTRGKKRWYRCRGYMAFGKGYCLRNQVEEKAITALLVRKLQDAYLDPGHLHELRRRTAELEAEQRDAPSRAAARDQLAALERQLSAGNERLLLLPADRLPGVIAKLREVEAKRDAVREQLRRAEEESPVEALEETIAAAEAALWRLLEALRAQDSALLRQVLRELIAKVELHWTHQAQGRLTRAHFAWGAVTPRATGEPSLLYPSAGQGLQVIHFTAADLEACA